MSFRTLLSAAMVIGAMTVFPNAAAAQMSNKPFSFKSGPSLGMSTAGRQAILNEQFFGSRPNVLLKSPDGRLLTLGKGSNGLAIVGTPSGELIPGYRGRQPLWSRDSFAGSFNSYFGRVGERLTTVNIPTDDPVTSWTSQVFLGTSGGSASSVDQWTDMVYY